MRIVRQILDSMPRGDYRIQDKKVTPPPRARIDESMEALIHHFKIFTEGFKVPEGEVYVGHRVAPWRARLLHRDRRLAPSRTACTSAAPSFVNLQSPAAHDARRPHRRRASPSSRRSTRSWARSTADGAAAPTPTWRSPARSSPATRVAESALDPAAAPRPGAGRLRHRRRDGAHRRAARRHAGRGARHRQLLRDVQASSRSASYLRQHLHEHLVPALGGDELLEHAEETLGVKAGGTTADGLFTLEDVECIAACTEAPCLQVNYRYRHKVTNDEFDQLSTTCAPAGSTTRSRRTARWPASASTSPADRAAGAGRRDGRRAAGRGSRDDADAAGGRALMTITDAPTIVTGALRRTTTATPSTRYVRHRRLRRRCARRSTHDARSRSPTR